MFWIAGVLVAAPEPIPVGRSPHGVAISPDGRRGYVTDLGFGDARGNTVSVIDTDLR